MKNLTIVIYFSLCSAAYQADACTVAVVSGKCTPDGRPLLWKQRDTDKLQNAIAYFNDGKHQSLGLIDSDDTDRNAVWIGSNSAGFAIMNSASYNLILKDTIDIKDQEGIVMRKALQSCATVSDFEKFLSELPRPLGIEANFGVIDAEGGAAFFEVDNFSFQKLDVNDPKIAPFGYLVHTNFSFTGERGKGSGHIRFATAEELFMRAAHESNLTPRFILQDAARCLRHGLTRRDLRTAFTEDPAEIQYEHFDDYIPRYSTSASVVIQGVKKGESPDIVTMWAIVGSPLTSIVTPLWLAGGEKLPLLSARNESGAAPLCDKAIMLKNKLFPVKRNYREKYINVNQLWNGKQTGILQLLRPAEDKIFEEAELRLEQWRKNKNFKSEIPKFYEWLDETITAEYRMLFGL